jgi:hypothetical protein
MPRVPAAQSTVKPCAATAAATKHRAIPCHDWPRCDLLLDRAAHCMYAFGAGMKHSTRHFPCSLTSLSSQRWRVLHSPSSRFGPGATGVKYFPGGVIPTLERNPTVCLPSLPIPMIQLPHGYTSNMHNSRRLSFRFRNAGYGCATSRPRFARRASAQRRTRTRWYMQYFC